MGSVKEHQGNLLSSVLVVAFFFFCVVFFFSGGFGLKSVEPKEKLDDYSWTELHAVSNEIGACKTEDEGIAIAKKYYLLDENGLVDPHNTKRVYFEDGSSYEVAVLGVLRDKKQNGEGYASISFWFQTPVSHRCMNSDNSNAGGWQGSELNSWMHVGLTEYLKENLVDSSLLEYCRTICSEMQSIVGDGAQETTENMFWLPSLKSFTHTEKFDDMSSITGTKQNRRYQYPSDIACIDGIFSGTVASKEANACWLQTPYDGDSSGFYAVDKDGKVIVEPADAVLGVLPAFAY